MSNTSNERACPRCGSRTTAPFCQRDGAATVPVEQVPLDAAALVLGRFRPIAPLDRDGPISIDLGEDASTGDRVRIARVHLSTTAPNALARAERLVQTLASLRHPHFPRVLASGRTADDVVTLVTADEGGSGLDALLAVGPLGVSRTVELGIALFDALAGLHDVGLTHRRLTPACVRLVRADGRERVVLLDAGLADLAEPPTHDAESAPSLGGLALAPYQSPEQARGRGITRHADLYAAGAVLYASLTGAPPFVEASVADYVVAHAVKLPPPPTLDGVTLSGALPDLLLRCLDKKPWRRPDSAHGVRSELIAIAPHPITIQTRRAIQGDAPPIAPRVPSARPATGPTTRRIPHLEATPSPSALPGLLTTAPTAPRVPPTRPPSTAPSSAPKTSAPLPQRSPDEAFDAPLTRPAPRPDGPRRARLQPVLAGLGLAAGVAIGLYFAITPSTEAHPDLQALAVIEPAPPTAPHPTAEPAPPTEPPRAAEGPAPATPPLPPTPTEAPAVATPDPEPPPPAPPKPAPARAAAPSTPRSTPRPPSPPKPARAPDPFADLEDPELVTAAKVANPPAANRPPDAAASRPSSAPVERRALLVTEPPGAKVMVDGQAMGHTPMTLRWTGGRSSSVELRLDGFLPASLQVGERQSGKMLRVELVPK